MLICSVINSCPPFSVGRLYLGREILPWLGVYVQILVQKVYNVSTFEILETTNTNNATPVRQSESTKLLPRYILSVLHLRCVLPIKFFNVLRHNLDLWSREKISCDWWMSCHLSTQLWMTLHGVIVRCTSKSNCCSLRSLDMTLLHINLPNRLPDSLLWQKLVHLSFCIIFIYCLLADNRYMINQSNQLYWCCHSICYLLIGMWSSFLSFTYQSVMDSGRNLSIVYFRWTNWQRAWASAVEEGVAQKKKISTSDWTHVCWSRFSFILVPGNYKPFSLWELTHFSS